MIENKGTPSLTRGTTPNLTEGITIPGMVSLLGSGQCLEQIPTACPFPNLTMVIQGVRLYETTQRWVQEVASSSLEYTERQEVAKKIRFCYAAGDAVLDLSGCTFLTSLPE